MKRVLLTGASGFIGSGVLNYLLEKTDWQFTLLCSWRHHGTPLNIKAQDRIEVISHDLTGPIPEIGQFDYILNIASESHVDRSIDDPVNFVENNVSSVLQMLEYARKHKPEVFIQFSTDEVYGAYKHEDWDVLLPSSPYAASKAAQEMIAISYWKTYDVPVVITNSNNIVGPNQHPEKFVPKIIQKLKAGDKIEIHTHNGKPGKRHYNPIQNVADALLFILDPKRFSCDYDTVWSAENAPRPSRFSLPGGEELSNLQMLTLVAKKLGVKPNYDLVEAESVRPGYDAFYPRTDDGQLAELGWVAPLTLEEGMEWIKSE